MLTIWLIDSIFNAVIDCVGKHFPICKFTKNLKNGIFEDKFEYGGAVARWRSLAFFITEKNRNLLAGARLSSSLQKKTEKTEKLQKFARYAHLLASSVAIFIMLATLASLLHYRNKRKKQKKTEICSLALAIFFITEKDGKNRIITEICSLRSLTCFVSRYLYYARWRSPLFFITEKNRKNRKKQKLLLAAGLSLTLTCRYTLSHFSCSLALASLLHYRKKQKKQKNYRNLLARFFFITEKDRNDRKKQKFACWHKILNTSIFYYPSLYSSSMMRIGARVTNCWDLGFGWASYIGH